MDRKMLVALTAAVALVVMARPGVLDLGLREEVFTATVTP